MRRQKFLPFIIVIIFCTPSISFAQSQSQKVSAVIPPSPEAAALAKYVETPVGYFNGSTSISIPLYEIIEGDIKVPISLAYHSSGIKVGEESTWVGLGFSLNVGGEIIADRRGFGLGDEIRPYLGSLPVGTSDYEGAQYKVAFNTNTHAFYHSEDGDIHNYWCETNLTYADTEPDLFMFNFQNYAGKFVFRRIFQEGRFREQKSEVIDRQKIDFTSSSQGMTAKTPDGFLYSFNEKEESSSSSTYLPSIEASSFKVTSYKLTSIQSPLGNKVTFVYDMPSTPSFHSPSFSQKVSFRKFKPNAPDDNGSVSLSSTKNKYLNSIYFSNGHVDFITSARLDICNGRKLDRIDIYNASGALVKSIIFNWNTAATDLYFNSAICNIEALNTHPEAANSIDASYISGDYENKRLKLSNVLIGDELYQFDYNSKVSLPCKLSAGQDYWGYYNGNNSGGLLPDGMDLQRYGSVPVPYAFYQGAIRTPHEANAQAGMLTAITYPTKGTTQFSYESNRFETDEPVKHESAVNANDANGTNDVQQSNSFTVEGMQHLRVGISLNGTNPSVAGTFYVAIQQLTNGVWQTMSGIPYGSNPAHGLIWDMYDLYNRYWNDMNGGYTNGFTYDPYFQMFTYSNIADVTFSAGTYRLVAYYPDGPVYNPTKYASIGVSYYTIDSKTTELLGGGLRVSKIVDAMADGKEIIRLFSYSGGVNLNKPIFARESLYDPNAGFPTNAGCYPSDNFGMLMIQVGDTKMIDNSGADLSSSMQLSYSNTANGSVVGYAKVSVTYAGNSKGKTEYNYKIISDDSNVLMQYAPAGMPTANRLENGLLLKQTDYRYNTATQVYEPLRVTTNNYDEATDKLHVWGFKIEHNDFYGPVWVQTLGGQVELAKGPYPGEEALHFYPVKMGRIPLSSTSETVYDGGTILQKSSNFTYTAEGFPKTNTTVNSNNQSIVTEYYYPLDYTNVTDNSHWISKMRVAHLLQYPIEVITRVNGQVVSAEFTEYQFIDQLFAPYKIYQLISSTPVSNFTLSNSSSTGNKDSRYNAKPLLIYQYDNTGNLVQTTANTGISTAYYYAYNNKLPVIKADNTTYTELSQKVALSMPSGYSLIDQFILSVPNTAWSVFNQSLRTNLDNGMVTTYTFDPLNGLTSATDVNNRATFYEYSQFSRLQRIKDNDQNSLMFFQYHFKN